MAAFCLALPASSSALGLSFTTVPGALTPALKPGATSTSTTGILAITNLTAWTLSVSDATNTGSTSGHLQRQACTLGTASLAQALSVSVSQISGTVTPASAKSLSNTTQTVATGNGVSSLGTSFSQTVGASEPLQSGCAYSVTVTFTLS